MKIHENPPTSKGNEVERGSKGVLIARVLHDALLEGHQLRIRELLGNSGGVDEVMEARQAALEASRWRLKALLL